MNRAAFGAPGTPLQRGWGAAASASSTYAAGA